MCGHRHAWVHTYTHTVNQHNSVKLWVNRQRSTYSGAQSISVCPREEWYWDDNHTAPSLWFRAISLVYFFRVLLKERLLDSLCRCTYLCVDTCAKYSMSTLHCPCHFLLMSACIQCCLLPVLQFDVAHCLTLSALDCMHGQGGTVWGFVFFSFALLAVWYFGRLWCLFCDICS